jgi:hypothetical protein
VVGPVTEGQLQLIGEVVGPALAVLEDAPAAVVLAALTEEGQRLDEAARARRTWASYRGDWRHFTDWCASVDLDLLPRHRRPSRSTSPTRRAR